MTFAFKFKVCAIVFLFCQLSLSQLQQRQVVQDEKTQTKESPTKEKPKIPAKDKKLALQMLEISDAQARGFEAPMRSYALLQIAQIYVTLEPEKARGLLGDAFTASVGIQDDDSTKARLQEEIFRTLLPIAGQDERERLAERRGDPRSPQACRHDLAHHLAHVVVGERCERFRQAARDLPRNPPAVLGVADPAGGVLGGAHGAEIRGDHVT